MTTSFELLESAERRSRAIRKFVDYLRRLNKDTETRTVTKRNANAEAAYDHAHNESVAYVQRIQVLLHEMPVSDCDEVRINWADVGSLVEVNRRLAAVVEFLEGTEQ